MGRVKSLVRRSPAILRPVRMLNGYEYVGLSPAIGTTRQAVSHLVLAAFVGPRPCGFEADHINSVRWDNRLENLRWISLAENRARRNVAAGERCGHARLTWEQVRHARKEMADGPRGTARRLALEYGVTPAVMTYIKQGKTWREVD